MKKTNLNFLVDSLSFVCFAFLTSTGIIMHYLLPPGSGRWQSIWGMHRHAWGAIHFWIAVVFLGFLVMHLIFHWRWIVRVLQGKSQEYSGLRLALGALGLFAVLALAVAPLVTGVEKMEPRGEQPRHQHGGDAR